ncbi:MAG: hypothetical protein WDZ80_04355 [Candidatus Paceibacterota bacterium]
MGIFNFFERTKQKIRSKKLSVVSKKIGNNFILLQLKKISLAECISTTGYFTQEAITILTNLDANYDQSAAICINYYLYIFKEKMVGDENYVNIDNNFRNITIWVVDHVLENNKSLKKDEKIGFEKQVSQLFRNFRKKIIQENISPLDLATKQIFKNLQLVYGHDISGAEQTIRNTLQSITVKFEDSLNNWDSSEIDKLIYEKKFRNIDDIGMQWF